MAEPWDFWGLAGEIRDAYPQFFRLIQKPGVFDVLANAVMNKWSPDKITDALKNTDYFRNTPEAVRELDILVAYDPASANQRGNDAARMVDDTVRQLGVQMSDADKFTMAAGAAVNGWDQNRLRYEILLTNKAPKAGVDPWGGIMGNELAGAAAQVRKIADSYGVPMGDDLAVDIARRVAAGTMTLDAVTGSMADYGAALYPILAPQIKAGKSVSDMMQPYLQMYVQETGDPNGANALVSDPKWTNLMFSTDETGGQRMRTPMETIRTIRSDPQYGWDQSPNAISVVAKTAHQLQQLMGIAG